MSAPGFGDRVVVTFGDKLVRVHNIGTLTRRRYDPNGPQVVKESLDGWIAQNERPEVYAKAHWQGTEYMAEERAALLIGWRTLKDGFVDSGPTSNGWDEPPEFQAYLNHVATYRVALVVVNGHTNPFYVFPSAIR